MTTWSIFATQSTLRKHREITKRTLTSLAEHAQYRCHQTCYCYFLRVSLSGNLEQLWFWAYWKEMGVWGSQTAHHNVKSSCRSYLKLKEPFDCLFWLHSHWQWNFFLLPRSTIKPWHLTARKLTKYWENVLRIYQTGADYSPFDINTLIWDLLEKKMQNKREMFEEPSSGTSAPPLTPPASAPDWPAHKAGAAPNGALYPIL